MRFFLVLAGLLGAQAIICGAISAHADLDDQARLWIDKAVQYEVWHVLGLVASVALYRQSASILLVLSAFLMTLGIVLFCGSLYMLGFMGNSLFSNAAPIGGSAFILGWLCLGVYGFVPSRARRL